MGVLQITPLRASRALALRFLAHRLGVELGREVTLVALSPEAQSGQGECEALPTACCRLPMLIKAR